MADYRITYDPYKCEVIVEKNYGGNPPYWDVIGENTDDVEWSRFVGEGKSLSHIAKGLLEKIESFSKTDYEINLTFNGLENDYKNITEELQKYKKEIPNSKYNEKIKQEKKFENPQFVSGTLKSYYEDIKEKFPTNEYSEIAEEIKNIETLEKNKNVTTILVAGEQNTGKSTFINALIGKSVMPMSGGVETANVYTIKNGNSNSIVVKNKSGYRASVDCDKNEFRICNNDDSELYTIFADIRNSTEIVQAVNKQAQWLKALNKKCREYQDAGKKLPFEEIEVYIENLKIGRRGYNFVLRDIPGSGASKEYYGEEHNQIIQNAARDTLDSLIIYLFSNDSFSRDAARNSLDIIINESAEGQIDVVNSIYVINKALGLEKADREETVKIKEGDRKFRDRSLVFADGRTALRLKEKQLGAPEKDNLTRDDYALYKDNSIPQTLKQKVETEMKDLKKNPGSNEDCLANTGIPCIEYMIDDYAETRAEIHKVNSYNKILDEILKLLDEKIGENKEKLEKEKGDLEKSKECIKNELKTNCDKTCRDWCNNFDGEVVRRRFNNEFMETYDNIAKELRKEVPETRRNINNEYENEMRSKKIEHEEKIEKLKENKKKTHDKDERRSIDIQIKKEENSIKEERRIYKKNIETPKTNKEVAEELSKKFNSFFDGELGEKLKEFKTQEITRMIAEFKEKLKKTIKGKLDSEQENELKKYLDEIPWDKPAEFIPDKDKLTFKSFFRADKKLQDEFYGQMGDYWDKVVIEQFVKNIESEMNYDVGNITKIFKEKIESISITLKEKNNEIKEQEDKIHTIQNKRDEVSGIVVKKNKLMNNKEQ